MKLIAAEDYHNCRELNSALFDTKYWIYYPKFVKIIRKIYVKNRFLIAWNAKHLYTVVQKIITKLYACSEKYWPK